MIRLVLTHFARLVWFILATLTKWVEDFLETRVARDALAALQPQPRHWNAEKVGIATPGILLHAHLTRTWPYPSGFT